MIRFPVPLGRFGCWLLACCLLPWPVLAAWTVTPSTTPAASRLDTVSLWMATDSAGPATAPELRDGALKAVVVGPGGDVYGAGYRDELPLAASGGHSVLVLTRHDSQGTLVWERRVDIGTGQLDPDAPILLAIDPNAHLYVSAMIYTATGAGDILLAEYNLTGNSTTTPICQATYDYAAVAPGRNDRPVGLAVDATGAYLLATVDVGTSDQDIALIKFLQGGCSSPVWQRAYGPGGNEAAGLYRDPTTGAIYVLGTLAKPSNGSKRVILKYDAAGQRIGQAIDGSGDETALAIAGDATNHRLYVTSTRLAQAQQEAVLARYDAALTTPPIEAVYTEPGSFSNVPVAPAVDPAHDRLFLAVRVGSAVASDLRLLKYDLALNRKWIAPLYDSGGDDRPSSLVVDANDPLDEVYVALTQGAIGHRDMALLHYETVSGQGVLKDTFTQDFSGGDDRALALVQTLEGTPGQLALYLAGGSLDNATAGARTGRISLLKYGHARPDLTTAVTSLPSSVINEGFLQASVRTENVQDALTGRLLDSPAFSVTFYLATTPTAACPTNCQPFTTGGTLAFPGGLASGAVATSTVNLGLPTASVLTPGSYYLIAIADEANAVPEQNENNNRWVSPTTIAVINPPDLTATAVTGPASVTAGASMGLNYTLQNLRAVPVNTGFVQSFFLRPDGAPDASTDIPLVGSAALSQFPASTTQNLTAAAITVPASTPAGVYRLGIDVDSSGNVVEVDETNNRFVASAPTIQVLPIPDLSLTGVSAPSGGVIGQTVGVTTTVTTTAAAVTAPFTVSIYLSTDATISPAADVLLACRSIASLAQGASDTATTTVTVPAGTSQGVYYLGAIVDSGAPACGGSPSTTLPESNEANNSLASSTTTSLGLPATSGAALPDLRLASVFAPSAVNRGTAFAITANVQNVLPKAAGPFVVRAYVSPDPVITTSDYAIGSTSLTGMLGNSGDPALAINATIPAPISQIVTWAPSSCLIDPTNPSRISYSSTCPTGSNGLPSSGGVSVESLPAGVNGYAEHQISVLKATVFGLSTTSLDNSESTIQYGFKYNGTTLTYIVENGHQVQQVAASRVGTTFRIERRGSEIIYYQNGVERRRRPISNAVVNSPMFVDVALLAAVAQTEVKGVTLVQDPVPIGNYYIGAVVDADGSVTEVDENNNAAVNGGAASSSLTTVAVVKTASPSTGGSGDWGFWLVAVLLLRFCLRRPDSRPRSP